MDKVDARVRGVLMIVSLVLVFLCPAAAYSGVMGEVGQEGGDRYVSYGPFFIDGQMYNVTESVEDGSLRVEGDEAGELDRSRREKVLGLWRFYQVTRRDPLFYTPLYDMPGFRKFEGYTRWMMLSDSFRDVPAWKRLYVYSKRLGGRDIIATDVLTGLERVQEDTSAFYTRPSYTNARELLRSYRRQVSARSGELGELIELTAAVEKPGAREQIVARSGRVLNESTFVDNLRLMNRNNIALREEISYREGLLEGEAGIQDFSRNPVNYTRLDRKEQLVGKQRKREWLMRWKTIGVPREAFNSTLHGPYQVNVPCFGGRYLVAGFEDTRAYPNLVMLGAYPRYGGTVSEVTPEFRRRVKEEAGKRIGSRYVNRMLYPGIVFEQLGNRTLVLNQAGNPFESMNCLYTENTLMEWQEVRLLTEQLSQEKVYQSLDVEREGISRTVETGRRLENAFLEYPSQVNAEKLQQNYRNFYLGVLELKSDGVPVSPRIEERAARARKLSLMLESGNAALEKVLDVQYHIADRFYWTFFQYRDTEMGPDERASQFTLEQVVNYSLYDILLGSARENTWRIDNSTRLYSDSRATYSHKTRDYLYPYRPGSAVLLDG